MARLVGINHVVLEVADLDAALGFYGRLFDVELRGRIPEGSQAPPARRRIPEGSQAPPARRSPHMAFVDMGDQFLVLAEVSEPDGPDDARHFGLVVDDREEVRRRLDETDAEILGGRGLDFRDPWGNHVQVVEYGDIQFSKTEAVLRGMGLDGLDKSPSALAELREKGLD